MATQYTANDFADLLKLPKGYKQFKKYIHTNKGQNAAPSTEHQGVLELDFWYEIECFKKDPTFSYAQALYSTYMMKISTVADSHKEEVKGKLDSKMIDATMFDGVQRDIFGIMRINFFRDYARTPEYLVFKAEVAEIREAAMAAMATQAASGPAPDANGTNGKEAKEKEKEKEREMREKEKRDKELKEKEKEKEKEKGEKEKDPENKEKKDKFKKLKKFKDPAGKPRKMCMKLLKDKVGNEIFKTFLESVLASESIEFWNAVENFRKAMIENPAKLHSRAMAIYDQYLAPGSPKEVNVDAESRRAVFHKLKISLFDYEVFDPLQDVVFNLLCSDCFHKFCITNEYKHWRKQQQKRKNIFFNIGSDDPPPVPTPPPISIVRPLSPARRPTYTPDDASADKHEIVYVDKQMCLQMLQEVTGCFLFHTYVEQNSPQHLRPFDCWTEMELFRITVTDNPLGCYTLARNIYYKYIEEGADLDVGLNHHLRGYLREKVTLSLFDSTLFIQAQNELLEMIKEPFMKFSMSEDFKEYKASVTSKKKKMGSLRHKLQLNPTHAGFNMYIEVLAKKGV